MYIKSTSDTHPYKHNIILDFDLKKIKELYPAKMALEGDIRCAFSENHFVLKKESDSNKNRLNEDTLDVITKRVLHCGYLSVESPVSEFYLFTVPNMVQSYEKNTHFNTLRNTIELKTGKDALDLVDTYWRKYISEKQANR